MQKDAGLTSVVVLLFLCTVSYAAIWYVHPDSTLNSIQTGLNNCSTGDTVLVGPGTYFENIIWPNTQSIDLVSEYGPDTTIVDGDSAGQVFRIVVGVDTTTVIRGFTIQHGYVAGDTDGAGILCDGASPRIVSNVFTANGANAGYYGGGAIACTNFSSAVVDSNTLFSNHGGWGGAIELYYRSDAIIINNLIQANFADTCGGGIMCWNDCDPTIVGNTIINNYGGWGGGIAIHSYSSPIISGNTISNNVATVMGGGIYCYNYVSPTIVDNILTGNLCGGSYGAGIRCSPNTSGTIKHCIISNNNGNGLSIRLSTPAIDSCAIENNMDSGIYIMDGGNPTINWCNIVGNVGWGVNNTNTSATIDAENNWWGDASGPGGVGPGTGSPVSSYVDYDPWLTDSVQGIGIEELEIEEPMTLSLQISPNPFRHTTNIRYMIHDTRYTIKELKLNVYDASGRLVKSFNHESWIMNHESSISWDGRDDQNRTLSSGIYFLKVSAGTYAETRKLILVR